MNRKSMLPLRLIAGVLLALPIIPAQAQVGTRTMCELPAHELTLAQAQLVAQGACLGPLYDSRGAIGPAQFDDDGLISGIDLVGPDPYPGVEPVEPAGILDNGITLSVGASPINAGPLGGEVED